MELGKRYKILYYDEWLEATWKQPEGLKKPVFISDDGEMILPFEVEKIKEI